MPVRILKFVVISTFLQIAFYWFTIELIQLISLVIVSQRLVSQYVLIFSIGLFSTILLVQNTISLLIHRTIYTYFLMFITSALITVAWIDDIFSFPFQTLCCIIISVVTIIIKPSVDKLISYIGGE